MAENVRPATEWNPWLWGWVASEDVARMHRMIMEAAETLPPHDVYFLNGPDTTALEPSMELIERFRPDLLPVVRGLEGHQAFFSCEKARRAFGWEPLYTWREYLK
ncbi:MAG TPA: NAD(P)-dependent oxidoreductase [Caldilineae bacterium]|nr:NAD(P)-dependent oxidoreductase [Caldilineae bacterium]